MVERILGKNKAVGSYPICSSLIMLIKRTKTEIENAVLGAQSLKEVLDNLGLRAAGGNYSQLKKWLKFYGIDPPLYNGRTKTETAILFNRLSDEDIFVENSTYLNGTHIKKRLVNMGWKYECMGIDCPNPNPVWRGKPLVLHLEHKNGIHCDNRLDNLEFLCPNCHTQTDTYAGRKRKNNPR